MDTSSILRIIEASKKDFETISDSVWDHPEVCFKEVESTKVQMNFMKVRGFRITTPLAEMKTAFMAEYGNGSPVIAILGENDALAGLSQKADVAHEDAIAAGGNGHGCGHNLLGTAGMEAVYALKTYMEENALPGTIRYYACPAEEGGGGKVFLSRAGVFDDVDCALTWHPGTDNRVDNAGLACVTFNLTYHGTAAHAAVDPWNGRSALDAVELLNVGVQFLREHVKPDTRIHYSILDCGGSAPNIVQHTAKVMYCVRARLSADMEDVYRRVLKVADGAALMTETTLDPPEIINVYNGFVANPTLDRLLLKHIKAVLPLDYTEEELAYARRFQACGVDKDAAFPVNMVIDERLDPAPVGSTDVADVSHVTPTSVAKVSTAAIGTPWHSWMVTAQGKSSIAKKGMHAAAAVLALSALDLFLDPSLVAQVHSDFMEATQGAAYHTMLPAAKKPQNFE